MNRNQTVKTHECAWTHHATAKLNIFGGFIKLPKTLVRNSHLIRLSTLDQFSFLAGIAGGCLHLSFPIGYQCDIGLAVRDRSIWGALYDESRRKKFVAEPPKDALKNVHQNDWNQIRILANGPKIQIFVNGQQTVDYIEQEKDIASRGIIGLQIHSGAPAEAWCRNVRIKAL